LTDKGLRLLFNDQENSLNRLSYINFSSL